ncbi:hypothetical protein BJY01DRAFT_220140 [Aspergillus pseudoustus]|uniref:Uncharacterized protein n=1 Tax=Aspergillus pseudoustus TaxID=1810923 RepID=A0ABR4JE37_9EURO
MVYCVCPGVAERIEWSIMLEPTSLPIGKTIREACSARPPSRVVGKSLSEARGSTRLEMAAELMSSVAGDARRVDADGIFSLQKCVPLLREGQTLRLGVLKVQEKKRSEDIVSFGLASWGRENNDGALKGSQAVARPLFWTA